MQRRIVLGVVTVALLGCREREQSAKDKELDVQLAQAKARQAEAEAEKAAIEARANQQMQSPPTTSPAHNLRMNGGSKDDVAQLAVKKYAYEAYGEWSQAHPDKMCPDTLADLGSYMDTKDTNDPWGHPYHMYCGQQLPAGAKGGLAVLSAGADGREGTDDDIKSW